MSRKEVIDKTLGEIRSFLDELSNGTSRYRSLHNLTEQVEHQYHGRFLIELIQNAHDALFEVGVMDTPQRIEIVLADDEHPHGALYIANDGQPFTPSNFKALSNLGQSDKDPQKSIGNKGIGFRSVLEITKAPEIYSRNERESSSFDGYCFSFQPDVIQMFEGPIRRVVDGDNSVESPEAIGGRLLEWDDARYEYFRERCRTFSKDWLREELAFLSPYALPIPMDTQQAAPRVADFEQRGFSTVIRLPFLNDRAREIATNKLEEMNESTAIFLQRVNELRLATNSQDRCYNRKQIFRNDDPEGGFEVQIAADDPETEEGQDYCRRYWLWKRTVGGEKNPSEKEEIQSAVADLPGKWPEVDEATVEIAVQVGSEPDDGVLNIYLPTQVPSGCAAHFSAPFFGDMSRTDIDFENPLNSLLLRTIAEKGVDVILKSLSGKGEAEAAAIIDILAPTDSDEGQRWWAALGEVFSGREIEIESQDIALSDEGWRSLVYTSLLPALESDVVIKASLLRSEATYPVFVQALRERESGIRRIFDEVNISPEAMPDDNAATIEAIARKLHESKEPVDWSGFWQDVESLFGKDTKPLIGKSVLLGTDNQLHSCDDRCSVFFRPRSSGSDDEVLAEGGIDDIPENLRPFIAFLNEDIQTHIPRAKGGVETTAVHRYLSTGLVQSYGVERIFSGVLVKATPKLPHDIDGSDSQLCRDILQWGLRLLQASKHSMEEPIRLLSKLSAPCIGGWYPIDETSFGPGWPGKNGAELDAYLRRSATPECSAALKRLLLPPDHPLWGGMGLSSADLLEKAGAFNGIRLVPVTGKDWDARFTIAHWKGVKLPEKGPAGYSPDVWDAYREYIKNTESPRYSGEFSYEVQDVYALPGFEKLEGFDDAAHKLLMELLLASIPSWQKRWKNWESATIRKIGGEAHRYSPVSPLAFSLRETKWMQGETDEETIRFRPSDRWHIPSPALIGGLHQFSHLMPMPVSVASVLSRNPGLTASMKELGMPSYDPEEETADPRLLNDLAVALQDPTIDISNSSVFLGQVRTAWGQFYPDEEDVFPDSVIVQNGSGSLIVVTPSEEEAVYLPDATSAVHSGLELHSKPVVAMDTKDAKRLQDHFQNAYGNGVRLASELTTRALVDGSQWQAKENTPQLSEELPWLIPIVLSIFAFSRGQSRGVGTKTFTKAIDALRRARIVWVDTLEAGLWHGDVSVARTPVPALWLPKDNTLLAISDARTEVSQLSEALASIVDRGDIDISLKLVLGDYESADEMSEDAVCASLRKLHITADHYQEVQQRWLGDLAWRVRLVRPLILLMQPDADIAPLDEVSSEEQFRDALQSYSIAPFDLDDVLSIVRDAAGLKSVGYKAWEILGDQAQLDQWNKVLSQSSESLVSNDQANAQFQEHMDSCRTIMRSIIRYTIRKHPESRGFKDYEAELLNLECPRAYAENYWVVAFPEVMNKVRDILVEWDTDSDVIALVNSAASVEELRDQLDELGLEPDLDPIEIHADNRKIFFRVLEGIQKSDLAWCIRENADVGMWGQDNDFFETHLADDFAKTAFVDVWNEAICFKLIGKLNQSQVHEGFWTALGMSSTVSELMDRLGISDAEMAKARDRLEERKQKQELQKKTVKVCGMDFVNSEENLINLWDHILGAIEDDSVATADLTDLEELKEQGASKKRKKGNKKSTNKKKPKGRISQAMKDLVGLAGEIHAFRALQKFYGIETVGPSSWFSENSRHKYPENTTDDGYGCDFVIHKNGKTHYVEVKATQAEDEAFELGSSEVELAIDSANRRKKEFVILHVLDALSDSPQFRLLPNPYDRKHRDKYKFEEAGLRVRYETT
ncbi:MAG: DUF3883 domain-containing protein [Candidatus Thiodiazotropha sp.]